MTIRRAKAKDIPWLAGELRAFDEFFPAERSLYPGDGTVAYNLEQLMNRDDIVFLVATNEVQPIGFILGAKIAHFFNPAIVVLQELLWWVSPEFRGSSAGLRLLHEFVDIGKLEEVDWITCSLETGSPVNPNALERRGFRLLERSFLMEL